MNAITPYIPDKANTLKQFSEALDTLHPVHHAMSDDLFKLDGRGRTARMEYSLGGGE